ncbi:MAG TPA: DUF47 family protein [Candidatus Poseidoniales archaeon]|nr:DUF47 family protein [Candidatus Poseidoniales archaeon]
MPRTRLQMWGGDSDKASTPLELFYAHAESVENTVNKMLEALSIATHGGDATDEIEATISAELRADELKMTLRDVIGGRELMLIIESGSFFHMLSRQDRIADYAQNVAEQLSFRELYDDEKALGLLQEMGEAVSQTVKDYVRAVKAMRDLSLSGFTKEQKQNLRKLIKEVNLREHEADRAESRAAAFVFEHGEDDPLAAMHMYRVLQRLDDVANACEKAANAFLPIVYR